MSAPVPRMTRTALSRNPRIPAFGAIPPHMSRLLVVETRHLFFLTGSPHLTLALIATALEPT